MKQQSRWRQAWTITCVEMRRAFFSKRAFWVYGLALFPSIIFLGHNVQVKVREMSFASERITPAQLESVHTGETAEAVIGRLGKTRRDLSRSIRRRISEKENEDGAYKVEIIVHRSLTYFDGRRIVRLNFENEKLVSSAITTLRDFEGDRRVFAGVFQFFYLRLAIFFGCLGIFMNLFRGEMLDKTLHYWLLAPARREVLLAGKYGAGLIASVVIFTGGALLCFGIMVWPHNSLEGQTFLRNTGMGHAFWYAVAAAMGCIGYGSVFLAAGLFLRNPNIPAVILLAWENINGFLPELLQKASIFYYLQSLCPVPAPALSSNAPGLLQLLLSPAEPASRAGAILGIIAITAVILWLARLAILRMQISYSGDN